MAKRKEHLSQAQIKIRILAYLYNRKNGANSYTIQHKANIPSQEYNRFKRFLDDLCDLSCLEKNEDETSGQTVRVYFKITDKGRTTVEAVRNPLIANIIGSIEDLFYTKS